MLRLSSNGYVNSSLSAQLLHFVDPITGLKQSISSKMQTGIMTCCCCCQSLMHCIAKILNYKGARVQEHIRSRVYGARKMLHCFRPFITLLTRVHRYNPGKNSRKLYVHAGEFYDIFNSENNTRKVKALSVYFILI